MSTFVTVGNAHQPFQRLLDAVAAAAAQLPQPVIVQYGHGRFSVPGCDARAFIPMDEFGRIVEAADLVIQHAGAGSVLHAIRAGKVPVVMPRRAAFGEMIDDHQSEIAVALAHAGKAVVVNEGAQLLAAAQQALAMQRERQVAARESALVRLVGQALQRYAQALR